MAKQAIDSIHFKWVVDGSKTWEDVIENLKLLTEQLNYLKKIGCKIEEEVNDGHLFYTIPKNKVKEYCKEWNMIEEDLYEENEDEN